MRTSRWLVEQLRAGLDNLFHHTKILTYLSIWIQMRFLKHRVQILILTISRPNCCMTLNPVPPIYLLTENVANSFLRVLPRRFPGKRFPVLLARPLNILRVLVFYIGEVHYKPIWCFPSVFQRTWSCCGVFSSNCDGLRRTSSRGLNSFASAGAPNRLRWYENCDRLS